MDKPFVIPKQLVWEAYKQVKRNKGAAGVDGMSMSPDVEDEHAGVVRGEDFGNVRWPRGFVPAGPSCSG